MVRLMPEERAKLLADYHTGQFTVRELAAKYGVGVATVQRATKGEPPKNKKVTEEISQDLTKLKTLTPVESAAVVEAAKNKAWFIAEFKKRAWKNQQKADEMLEYAEDMGDIEAHSRITQRNKETICGKEPSVQIENKNEQTNQTAFVITRKTLGRE